jgi:hypothetical protein
MKLIVQGRGSVELNQADFVAQGGEGAIYVKGDQAFKVYSDPAKMIPAAKMRELSALTLPNIVRPQEALLDTRQRPVGYTMRRVQNGTPLCCLFTRAFRERKGVTPEQIAQWVQKLREGVDYVHGRSMLIVDLNEMNLLADLPLRTIYFIDVDSYQTPNFPATAIMESVRDRHASRFNENTDWFAFAIVSFQLFVGIHPYKGKHPTLTDLEARMQQNVSVFNAKVSLPKVCYPFEVIPQAYRDWYRAVFEEGKRCAPPDRLVATIVLSSVQPQAVRGDKVHLHELARYAAEIVLPLEWNGETALTADGLYTQGRRIDLSGDAEIVFTPARRTPMAAWVEAERLLLYDLATEQSLGCQLRAEALTRCEERLYVKSDDGLYEVEFVELPTRVLASSLRRVGNALPRATKLYDGVAIQSLLGACYIGIFPERGHYRAIRVPELDGYTILNARYDHGVLMAVGARGGRYDLAILRLNAAYSDYDLRLIADVPDTDINFVTLPSGVCIRLAEDGELELFYRKVGSNEIKLLKDAALQGARLFARGTQLLCGKAGVLYSMTMQP